MRTVILSFGLALNCCIASAAETSPVGSWITIDDKTQAPSALVEIAQKDDALYGRITKLFRNPSGVEYPVCKECTGERKDQPIIGMEILWNLHRDGDEWVGGEILDPEEGKTYRCKIHLTDDGTTLEVRGFIGFSLLGRTQIWTREQPGKP